MLQEISTLTNKLATLKLSTDAAVIAANRAKSDITIQQGLAANYVKTTGYAAIDAQDAATVASHHAANAAVTAANKALSPGTTQADLPYPTLAAGAIYVHPVHPAL